jgi:hypothetical protein
LSVTAPVVPPPVRPAPAVTPVMSPVPPMSSGSQVTVPFDPMARIDSPTGHTPVTRACTRLGFTLRVTSPEVPTPTSPAPASTPVMSPPLDDDTAAHTTVPSWFTPVINCVAGQVPLTRFCTSAAFTSMAATVPSAILALVTAPVGMPAEATGRGDPAGAVGAKTSVPELP